MIIFNRFILMIQFLTRIPIPYAYSIEDQDIVKGSIFMPLVGFMVGAVMLIGYLIGSITPYSYLPAIMAVAFQMLVTGVLHLDGLGDTFDGLFSNKSKHRMLEIMRDSRIGNNAAAAIVISLLIRVLILSELSNRYNDFTPYFIILALPVIGKIGILTSAAISKYPRDEIGLGNTFVNGVGFLQWIIGSIFAIVILISLFGLVGIIHYLVSLLTAILVTTYIKSRIGGMTGDTLGAANEICELIFLITFINIQMIIS